MHVERKENVTCNSKCNFYLKKNECSLFTLMISEKGATYEFRVKAKNEVGLGERASAIIITPDGGMKYF